MDTKKRSAIFFSKLAKERFATLFTIAVLYALLSFLMRAILLSWTAKESGSSLGDLLRVAFTDAGFCITISLAFLSLYALYLLFFPGRWTGSLALLNTDVINNYSRPKASLFFLPALLLIIIVLFLRSRGALSTDGYVQIQRDSFLFLNSSLGRYPNLQLNLTQLGDALISLSFLSIFLVYAPKIWESLISALLVSLLLSRILKEAFAIPRPAAMFDNNSFIITGERLAGYNSFPSGHSIIVFSVLTILLFAFMPQKSKPKIAWISLIIVVGLILAFTRVGIGAHYPIDVITGSIIGYISGLAGILISRKYKVWAWINNKKYYPVFILLFLSCCVLLINKIIDENLLIFHLSLVSLAYSLYKITTVYAKK